MVRPNERPQSLVSTLRICLPPGTQGSRRISTATKTAANDALAHAPRSDGSYCDNQRPLKSLVAA